MKLPLFNKLRVSHATAQPLRRLFALAILFLLLCEILPNRVQYSQGFTTGLQEGTTSTLFQINSSTGQYRYTNLTSAISGGRGIEGTRPILSSHSLAVIVPLYQYPITSRAPLCAEDVAIPLSCYQVPPASCGTSPNECKPGPNMTDPCPPCTTRRIPADEDLSISWHQLIAAKKAARNAGRDIEVWAVINPNNGPGTVADNNYKFAICQLRTAGIKIMGYVCTRYACQPSHSGCTTDTASEVKTALDNWVTLYGLGTEDGIFFDELASKDGPSCEMGKTRSDFYREINNYAKVTKGFKLTVGNPGTIPDDVFFGTVDVTVIYENDGFPNSSSGADLDYSMLSASTPEKRAILAHSVRELPPEIDGIFMQAADNVKYIYATNDCLNNRVRPCGQPADFFACEECAMRRPPPNCLLDSPRGPLCVSCSCLNPWDEISCDFLNELFRRVSLGR